MAYGLASGGGCYVSRFSRLHNHYFSDRITKKNYCGCGALMEC